MPKFLYLSLLTESLLTSLSRHQKLFDYILALRKNKTKIVIKTLKKISKNLITERTSVDIKL